jgi:hypothetical protein
MKTTKQKLMSLVLVMGFNVHMLTAANPAPVDMRSTAHFTILAGAGITFAGAANSTTNVGDIGTFPTTTITGLDKVVLMGINHAGDAVTQTAKVDLVTSYNDAAGRSADVSYPAIFDIGGLTLNSGVYHEPSSLGITGTLTLDGQGNPNAVWIFQIGSTLTAESGSTIVLTNGAQARNVFWQVGSSATLETTSNFKGTIMAQASITMKTLSTLEGRALAQTGTVTVDGLTGILPMPEAPRFTNIYRSPNDAMTVILNTTPHFLLTLETCPDLLLTNWVTLTTATPTVTPWVYTDSAVLNVATQRFYRAFISLY